MIAALSKLAGRQRAILGLVLNALWGMEQIEDHVQFAMLLHEDRDRLHRQARQFQENALTRIRQLADAGTDVAYLPNDVAPSTRAPISHLPCSTRSCCPTRQSFFAEIRRLGMIGVYHSDGNVSKLLDSIMALGAHALQSIDPMAGMDIKRVKQQNPRPPGPVGQRAVQSVAGRSRGSHPSERPLLPHSRQPRQRLCIHGQQLDLCRNAAGQLPRHARRIRPFRSSSAAQWECPNMTFSPATRPCPNILAHPDHAGHPLLLGAIRPSATASWEFATASWPQIAIPSW